MLVNVNIKAMEIIQYALAQKILSSLTFSCSITLCKNKPVKKHKSACTKPINEILKN